MPAFVPSLDLHIDVASLEAHVSQAVRQIELFEGAALEGFADGQLESTFEVYDRSQIYVPRDTGALAASGKVVEFSTQAVLGRKRAAGGRYAPKSSTFGTQIVYGGPDGGVNPKTGQPVETYAVIVHESVGVSHQPPTQAKYLEKAVNEVAPDMATQAGEGIVRATRSAQL